MESFSTALYFRLSECHPCWGLFPLVSMPVLACRGRVTIVMAALPACGWAVVPCLHGCPAFLQRHSPWQSPPSHPLRPETISPESTAVFALGLLSNAPFQLLATIHSGELASLSRVCKAATWKSVWVLTPFRLSWICCFTLQQPQILPLCPKQLLRCGDLTPASVLPPARRRSSCAHSYFFPFLALSYWVLCGSIYSFPLVRYSCPLSAGVPQDILS